MTMILSIIHYKGGVGKTTTACNLAGAAFQEGCRVLLLDLDPQGSLSAAFGVRDGPTAYDWLKGDASTSDVVTRARPSGNAFSEAVPTFDAVPERTTRTGGDGLGILPAPAGTGSVETGCIDVIRASEHLTSLQGALRSKQLLDFLARFFGRGDVRRVLDSYAYVVIDCPPGADFLAENALRASDVVLSTMELAYMSTTGLLRVAANVRLAREEGYTPRWLVLPTRYRSRRVQTRHVHENLLAQLGAYPEGVVLSAIHESVDLAYAYDAQQTVFEFAPTGRGAECYAAVFRQLEDVRATLSASTLADSRVGMR